MKKILVVPLLLIMAMLISCSNSAITDPAYRTLRYEQGDTQGSKFKECLGEGEKLATNDALYPYPTTQREDVWDTDGYEDSGNGMSSGFADQPDMVVQDKDGNDVFLKVKVQFFQNTSCDPVKVGKKEYEGGVLQVYHETIGKTRKAFFKEDGTYGPGWIWAMKNYISGPTIKLVGDAAKNFAIEDIWLKSSVKNEMAAMVQEKIQAAVNEEMQGDLEFYNNLKVNIYGASPNLEFKKLYDERKSAQVRADTAEKNKAVKIAEAQADAAVAQEQAKALQAEINGAGGPQWYYCGKSIEKGMPCFQPGGILLNPNAAVAK